MKTHKKQVKNTVYATATIVTGLSVFKRALGFLYRIVLSRLIGAEGMGLYQIAYSLFAVFLTLSGGGIPVTVSRLISKGKAERAPKDESAAVAAGILSALVASVLVLLLLLPLSQKSGVLLSDDRAASVLRILSIGLVFSSVYAVLKGSFFGNKQFLLPSLLELLEESVMTIAGVLLLQNASGALSGAEKAAWAVVLSYVVSFVAALISFFVDGGKLSHPKPALRPLLSSAVPITSVRVGSSLVNSAIAVLLPAMLIRAGYSDSEALTLFGVASGMALPVLMLPATVIGSFTTVLMPRLSEDFYGKKRERLYTDLERGLRAAFLVAIAVLPFLLILGKEVGFLAFSNLLAGEMLQRGCFILLPMSLAMMTTSMLNCMGFEKQTFFFYFFGAAAMFLCVLFLPAVCGVYAYVFGLGANFTVVAVCDLIFLDKKCDGFFKKYGKPLLVALARAGGAGVVAILAGIPFSRLCFRVFGAIPACIVVALFLCLILFGVYALCGGVRFKRRKK